MSYVVVATEVVFVFGTFGVYVCGRDLVRGTDEV